MIRITVDSSKGLRLVVEGHLSGQAVDQLRRSCADLTAGTALDLSGVVFADRIAAAALTELSGAGFVLEGCSGFIDELLREARGRRPRSVASGEAALIAGLRAGDHSAYEQMVRRYGGRMLAAARRILHNESDARDAVQDAFLSAFRSLGNFAGEAALGTWLHRIAINAALMQVRSRRRRLEQPLEQPLPHFDEHGNWADDVSAAAVLDDPREARERWATVRKCLDRLPQRYRVVLLLRDIEDLDTAQTARMLNITPTAVKVRLHRARQALKTLVEREMGASYRADACTGAEGAPVSSAMA